MDVPVSTIIALAFAAGIAVLQTFLSKRESRWLGLVLPLISLAYSLLMILNIAVTDDMGARGILGLVVVTFLLSNIPTIILIAIYFGCRENRRRKKSIDRMSAQDLE